MDSMERDASASYWAKTLHGTDCLYKYIPLGGLFTLQKDGPVFRKQSNGYRHLDQTFRYPGGGKPGLFKTGSRTAVFPVTQHPL